MKEGFFILVDDAYGPIVYGPYNDETTRRRQLDLLLKEDPPEPSDTFLYLDQDAVTGSI